MRSGLNVLVAVAIAAGVAACEPQDERFDTFETEEFAPDVEPALDAVITADLEPTEHATTDVAGTVRIFPGTGTAAAPEMPATPGEYDVTPRADVVTGQGFTIEVTARGLAPETEYGWQINRGNCGDESTQAAVALTDTEEGEGIAEALRADQAGSAQATATVPAQQLTLAQLQDEDYNLTLHRQADAAMPVACADLNGGIF